MPVSEWQNDVRDFVAQWLPPRPAKVLEVGCGEGELALELARAYDVTAIDPRAPEGAIFRQVTLEEFAEPGPFDACVAVVSLHHIADIEAALTKIAGLLTPGGNLVAVEFAWDNFDEPTARWALDHLSEGDEGWLHRRRAEWQESRLTFAENFKRWASEENMHTGPAMLAALGDLFDERFFARTPYLFPDLSGVTADDEAALIASGEIAALGFRFVGSPR